MDQRVLVVDDSTVIRASIRSVLETDGVQIEEARDGRDGIEVLQKLVAQNKRPSMIITDINMPIMNGLEFIKCVKTTSCKFVPILVLTTEAVGSMIEAGRKAGAAGWLVKPFDESQLRNVVRKFVR